MPHASGTFDVTLTPQGTGDETQGSTLARLSIDKRLHGDLDATSSSRASPARWRSRSPMESTSTSSITRLEARRELAHWV